MMNRNLVAEATRKFVVEAFAMGYSSLEKILGFYKGISPFEREFSFEEDHMILESAKLRQRMFDLLPTTPPCDRDDIVRSFLLTIWIIESRRQKNALEAVKHGAKHHNYGLYLILDN